MNYAGIDWYSTQNGDGIRIALFVSGCRLHCKGCFNKEAQNFKYGSPFTIEVEDSIIKALKNEPCYSGISILGGEPMEPENRDSLIPLVQRVKDLGKTIWLWSGYTYKQLTASGKFGNQDFLKRYVDVLVDGPFVLALKDSNLQYRGSSNQQILFLKKD